MVKRSIEQDLRNRNFGTRKGNYERNALVKNQGTKQRGQKILGDCWQCEAHEQCSKGDNCSFRHDVNERAKMTQPNPSPNSFTQQNERNASRTRSLRGKSPSGRMSRWPCKDHLKGTCTNCSVKSGTLQNACCTRPRVDADLGKSALVRIARLKNSQAKGPKKNDDKSAVAMLKYELHDKTGKSVVCRHTRHAQGHGPVVCTSSSTRHLGCVLQDKKPPKLSPILRKSSDVQTPIQRVKFTKAIARHTKIRDQNPSLGLVCPGEPHQRSPNAPKYEDRSQEETKWQEQGAREAAWKLAESVLKLKEKNKATCFSPSAKRCLPASTYDSHNRQWRRADA